VTRSWAGKRVLVTGARGFYGGHALARARALGAEIFGIARQALPRDDGVRWVCGDLTDPDTVRSMIKQTSPDLVLHLAGQTISAPDRELVLPSFRNNLASTVNVLLATTEVGCERVVVTGSLEEPKWGNGEAVPESPYGASKWAEVMYARMFHALYQLPVVTVRPFITYGPQQRFSKLVPSLALSLMRGRSPTVSQPDREADWIYIHDVIDGIMSAATISGIEGKIIELGSGQLISVRHIAEQLQQIIGGSVRFAKSERSSGVHGRQAELELARDLLGWQPKTSLRQGLLQTVEWYRARLDDFPDPS